MELERHIFAKLRQNLARASSPAAAHEVVDAVVAEFFPHARVVIYYCGSESGSKFRWLTDPDLSPLDLTIDSKRLRFGAEELQLPLYSSDLHRTRLPSLVVSALLQVGIHSIALVPLFRGGALVGVLECRFVDKFHRWRREETFFLECVAEILGLALARIEGVSIQSTEVASPAAQGLKESPTTEPSKSGETSRPIYERIAQYGDLLIVRADAAMRVTDVIGDTVRMLGVTRDELVRDPLVWKKIAHASDLRRVLLHVRRGGPGELREEIRITHQKSGSRHHLLVKGIPIFSQEGVVLGWEGFGVDFTDREEAEERLRAQGRRIEALYEVARSLELNLDPGVVALKGLRALIKATGSHCGFICLSDAQGASLEIAASEGLSTDYIEQLGKVISERTLARYVVEQREGMVLDDIQNDPRAKVELAEREGLRAAMFMPLLFEELVLGVVVLFRRDQSQYTKDDFDLVSAACSQIALAARQAELYAAEKRQSSSFSALYRLSHELAKQVSIKEVAEQAFPAIQEEIACKRMWLGVINQRGTHLEGQAGAGPGVRRTVIDLQIELNNRVGPLEEAIQRRAAVVVDSSAWERCPELARVCARLECGTVVIVPLVSLGQVVGVLIVEPTVGSSFFLQRKLPLLNSMATEIATVILARKFEARMADADKMRMAGLLASGVAHNFNNLLQAVMGQASLIEMQVPHDPRVASAARMIAEAAAKGAALVKQLFNFSMQGSFNPVSLSVQRLFRDGAELYHSVLGAHVRLELDVSENCPDLIADPNQVQTVLTNLLVNAREAIGEKVGGAIKITARPVRIRSGEVDPELAPGMYVRIDVEDNGAGMTPESQARCFEPFFTTKNTDTRTGLGFGGSGLGLSSAYSIMKQHDGFVAVKSQVGEGSIFTLYLPTAAAREVEKDREGVLPQVPVQVLFFELDQATAFSLKASVEAPGVQVQLINSRDRFLQLVERDNSPHLFALVDLDRLGNFAPEFLSRLDSDLRNRLGPNGRRLQVSGLVADIRRWRTIAEPFVFVELAEKPPRIWNISERIRRFVRAVQPDPASEGPLGTQVIAERVQEDGVRPATNTVGRTVAPDPRVISGSEKPS